MSWTRNGTVTLTSGSREVLGAGTLWLSTANPGDTLYGDDGRLYEIESITTDVRLMLATAYEGPTVAGADYAILPTQDAVRLAAANLAQLLRALQLQTMPLAASTSGADRFLINQAGVSRAITLAELSELLGGGGGGGSTIDLPLLGPAALPLNAADLLLVNQGGTNVQINVANLRAQLGGIAGALLEVDTGDATNAANNFTTRPKAANAPLLTNAAPSGSGGYALQRLFAQSDVANAAALALEARPTFNEVRSDRTGTGAAQELRLRAGSAAQLRLLTSGHLNFRAPAAASLANGEHSLNPAANDRMRVSYRDGAGVTRQRDILLRESTALWFVDDEQYCVWFTGGAGGEDVTEAVRSATFAADTLKVPLMLPPWRLRITGTFLANRIIGKPGSSGFIVNSVCTMGGFANQSLVNNRNFTQGFNLATADSVYYFGFEFDVTPFNDGMGVLMLGGCREVTIDKVNAIARRNDGIVAGRPVAVNSLIDLYCTNRHVRVTRCQLRNITGAWGPFGRIGPDGGACMWIRNLRGGTPAQANEYASFDIKVHDNYFEHLTSDEALAVFGVWGIVRDWSVSHNHFEGLAAPASGMHCGTFISAFPLRFNSGGSAPALDALGATAAVYNGEICNNTIRARAVMFNVIRIGNGNDPLDRLNPCYNIRSHHNHVIWERSSDPVTGPKAVWLAEGSPGGPGNDPDIVSASIICQNGQFGLAYIADSSGNTSSNDVALNLGGAAIASAYYGWDSVENPLCYGNFYNGLAQCKDVMGGKVEVFARPFYNCWSVNGTRYRCAGSGGDVWVFTVEDASGANYSLLNTNGESFGGFVRITNQTEPASRINIIGNTASVAQFAAVTNESVKGVVVTARNNTLNGNFSKPMQGGTFFNRIFIQASAPTALGDRDLWLDSDDGNRIYRWSAVGSAWQTVPTNENTAIVQALAPARAGVDNVFDVYYQSAAPTASGVANLWFDAGDRYKLYEDTGTWTPTSTPLGLAIVRVSGVPFIYASGNAWGPVFD